jgi:hypothetical protein
LTLPVLQFLLPQTGYYPSPLPVVLIGHTYFLWPICIIEPHHYLHLFIVCLDPFLQVWIWQQYVPPKHQYEPVTLYSIKNMKNLLSLCR